MWTDEHGERVFSPPLPTWTAAELYRRATGDHAVVLEY
jgi:hypothetical protein